MILAAIAAIVALPLLFLLADLARGGRRSETPEAAGRPGLGDTPGAQHSEDVAYRQVARALQR